jgi:hypothetical protein
MARWHKHLLGWTHFAVGNFALVVWLAICAHAQGCPPNSHPVSTDDGTVTIVHCQCNGGFTKTEGECRPVSSSPGHAIDRANALENDKAIQNALSKGEKPSFGSLLQFYEYNRGVVWKMVGDSVDRCALVLSMTLRLTPELGSKDASLYDLHKNEVTDAEIGKRYYIRAHEIADRLTRDPDKAVWKAPQELDGQDALKAKQFLDGKRGILYIEHAYLEEKKVECVPVGWRFGDHIDLWDGHHFVSGAGTPFEPAREDPWWSFAPGKAAKVLFWEIPSK